jgi:hypothetical protein
MISLFKWIIHIEITNNILQPKLIFSFNSNNPKISFSKLKLLEIQIVLYNSIFFNHHSSNNFAEQQNYDASKVSKLHK